MNEHVPKITNIKSEVLYRSAEDDFFYFYKISKACGKLSEALKLTPGHLKSLILLADATYLKGNIKKALYLYLQAEKLNPFNVKILASIANCYYNSEEFSSALLYCDKTISRFDTQNYNLFSQVFEIKINILMFQKKYKQAYEVYQNAKKIFDVSFVSSTINYKLLNEKINIQKKLRKTDLKIV